VNAEEQARDERYQEVSLRAVELLAKAQRAADEAVAEAQSYARDLENSAREQYKQILLRAQSAAQQLTTAQGAAGEPATAPEGSPSAVDAQQLAYVRTYARVAHAQLKSVLAALNDELDQLAAMADGSVQGPAMPPPAPGPQAPPQAARPVTPPESTPDFRPDPPSPAGPAPQSQPRPAGPLESALNGTAEHHPAADTHSWPPIAAPTNSISYFYGGSTWQGPRV
jgi:hypothetical protein